MLICCIFCPATQRLMIEYPKPIPWRGWKDRSMDGLEASFKLLRAKFRHCNG